LRKVYNHERDYSAHLLLAVKLVSPETGEMITDLPRLKQFVDKTVHIVSLEHMHRQGLIELTLPESIHDDHPFDIRITQEGRIKLHEMERRLGS